MSPFQFKIIDYYDRTQKFVEWYFWYGRNDVKTFSVSGPTAERIIIFSFIV